MKHRYARKNLISICTFICGIMLHPLTFGAHSLPTHHVVPTQHHLDTTRNLLLLRTQFRHQTTNPTSKTTNKGSPIAIQKHEHKKHKSKHNKGYFKGHKIKEHELHKKTYFKSLQLSV